MAWTRALMHVHGVATYDFDWLSDHNQLVREIEGPHSGVSRKLSLS